MFENIAVAIGILFNMRIAILLKLLPTKNDDNNKDEFKRLCDEFIEISDGHNGTYWLSDVWQVFSQMDGYVFREECDYIINNDGIDYSNIIYECLERGAENGDIQEMFNLKLEIMHSIAEYMGDEIVDALLEI